MENCKIDKLIDILKDLWPTWECNPTERIAWERAIRGLPYGDVQSAAIDFYNEQTRNYTKPIPRPIVEKAKAAQQNRQGYRKNDDEAKLPCLVYSLCKTGSTYKRGFFLRKRESLENINTDKILSEAHDMKIEHERFYGGIWRVELALDLIN